MATTKKHIINRTYIVSVLIFILAISIVVKLVNIQFVKGDYYIGLSKENNIKNVIIPCFFRQWKGLQNVCFYFRIFFQLLLNLVFPLCKAHTK